MKIKDPIVEEVRKHRWEHTRKFNGDLAAICADLRAIQAASGLQIVRLAPKRLESTPPSGRLPERPEDE